MTVGLQFCPAFVAKLFIVIYSVKCGTEHPNNQNNKAFYNYINYPDCDGLTVRELIPEQLGLTAFESS